MIISDMYRRIGRIFNYDRTGSIEVESYKPDGDIVISANQGHGRVSLHIEAIEAQKLIHLLEIGIRQGRGKKPIGYSKPPAIVYEPAIVYDPAIYPSELFNTGCYGYPHSKRTVNNTATIAEIDHTIRYKKFKISRLKSDIKKLKEDIL